MQMLLSVGTFLKISLTGEPLRYEGSSLTYNRNYTVLHHSIFRAKPGLRMTLQAGMTGMHCLTLQPSCGKIRTR